VSWRSRISLFVLVVLAGLPVAGNLCVSMCDEAATESSMAGAHHHHSGPSVTVAGVDWARTVVQQGSHDCQGHDAVVQGSTTAAERADARLAVAPSATLDRSVEPAEFSPQTVSFVPSSPPPVPAPATATPVVLRA